MTSAYSTISQMNWNGIQSQKFKTNRSHKTIPQNQLNFRLESIKVNHHSTGRKHFDVQMTIGNQQIIKKHIRTFDQRYKSKILNFPQQKKLIKIYVNQQGNQLSKNYKNNSKPQFNTIGMSKIKALQKGQKKTGIYRNFYKTKINTNLKQRTKSCNLYPSQIYTSKQAQISFFP